MNINKENIDEIIFKSIEGELSENENSLLKDYIQKNKEYLPIWNAWQKTIISPNAPTPSVDFSHLKKSKKRIIPLYLKWSIAASLALLFGFIFMLSKNETNSLVDIENPHKNLKKRNTIENKIQDTIFSTDSNKFLKENIRFIALEKHHEKIKNIHIKNKENIINNQEQIIEEIEVNDEMLVKTKHEPHNEHNESKQEITKINSPSNVVITEIKPKENSSNLSKNIKKFFALKSLIPKVKIEENENSIINKKIKIENDKTVIVAGF